MNTDCKILWRNCLDVIRDIIPEAAFNTWFKPIVPLKYEGNVLTIQVPSQFFYEYLEDKYIDLIQQTLYRKIGEGTILNYRILIEAESNTTMMLGDPKLTVSNKNPIQYQRSALHSTVGRLVDSQINPKYTFNNFFGRKQPPGTAAKAVSSTQRRPLTLFHYGKSGVGNAPLPRNRFKFWNSTPRRCSLLAHCSRCSMGCKTFQHHNDFIASASINVLIIVISRSSGLEKRRTPSSIYSTISPQQQAAGDIGLFPLRWGWRSDC